MDKYILHYYINAILTLYVPCGFAIIDVPSPKIVQQVLSSQFVITVAKSGFSTRVHFTFRMMVSVDSAMNENRLAI